MSHLKLVVNNTEKNKKKSQKRNSSQSVLDCDPFSELNLAYYDKDDKRLINMQPETSGLLGLEKLNAPVQLYQIHDILEGTLNQICINDLQREFAGENRTYCPFFTEFKQHSVFDLYKDANNEFGLPNKFFMFIKDNNLDVYEIYGHMHRAGKVMQRLFPDR